VVSFLRTTPGVTLVSLALAAGGVGTLAAYAPRRPPLTAPAILIALSALLCAAAAAQAAREGIARNVAVPTAAAATLAAAFLELVFTYDGTRGWPLALLTAALVLVALDLPLLLGTSVASYMAADQPA
jgi:hypothetical protein